MKISISELRQKVLRTLSVNFSPRRSREDRRSFAVGGHVREQDPGHY